MIVDPTEFLAAHAETWIAQPAPRFAVVNIHIREVSAPPEIIFVALGDQRLLSPAPHWRFLFAIRAFLGRTFRWDRGLTWRPPEQLVPGNHYAFFRIEHVAAPDARHTGFSELGMSVDDVLTGALLSWVLIPIGQNTQVCNITCANFPTRPGKAYWAVIRPFHNALIEDSLVYLGKKLPPR
jgi:Protein of unknown function (DUF2867)